MDLAKKVEMLEEQCRNLEKIYKEDTEALIKERDMWKDRCLDAEAKTARDNRQLRHV